MSSEKKGYTLEVIHNDFEAHGTKLDFTKYMVSDNPEDVRYFANHFRSLGWTVNVTVKTLSMKEFI